MRGSVNNQKVDIRGDLRCEEREKVNKEKIGIIKHCESFPAHGVLFYNVVLAFVYVILCLSNSEYE